jgi:hypothetical protein
MVPELVTVNVTVPGAAVAALSLIEYSFSVAEIAVVDADAVEADGDDAAVQAVARISTATRPAIAVKGRFMVSPILK